MKCIGIVWLVLATTVRVFGQDAPSTLQAYGDAGKYASNQFTLPEKGPNPDGSGIARPNGSTEVVWTEIGIKLGKHPKAMNGYRMTRRKRSRQER